MGEHLLVLDALLDVAERRIDVEAVSFDEEGHEKRDALNMVPVGVREKDAGDPLAPSEFPFHELGGKVADAGAAVNDEQVVIGRAHLEAGRVAAVGAADGIRQGIYAADT